MAQGIPIKFKQNPPKWHFWMHLVNVAVLVNFAYRTNLKTITISRVRNYLGISKIVLKMLSSVPYPIFPLKYGQISTFISNHMFCSQKNWLSWETAHTIYRRVLNRVPGYGIDSALRIFQNKT